MKQFIKKWIYYIFFFQVISALYYLVIHFYFTNGLDFNYFKSFIFVISEVIVILCSIIATYLIHFSVLVNGARFYDYTTVKYVIIDEE